MMETVWSQALDLLKRDGWTKNDVGSLGSPMCLAAVICYQPVPLRKTLRKLSQHLGLAADDGSIKSIFDWNDAPERTFDQVKKLLTELHEKELADRGLLHGQS